jgi:hypothetical protein
LSGSLPPPARSGGATSRSDEVSCCVYSCVTITCVLISA